MAETVKYWTLVNVNMLFAVKVYKYKVVSTSFNDDIYGIDIIYLQERLHVLDNILAMGSLVWRCCHQLTIII
jgi:uncharacterized protein YebE (UPF0316 family)